MITKGTKVIVRTTNGGEVVGVLDHNYAPSYSVTVVVPHGYVCIIGWRVKSVSVV